MIYINNDDFTLNNTDNFYTSLDDIPKTTYESSNYDIKEINANEKGFNYATTYFNLDEGNGYDMVYGTITINNNNSLNSAVASKQQGFWGERITLTITRNEYYYVSNIECSIVDSAIKTNN